MRINLTNEPDIVERAAFVLLRILWAVPDERPFMVVVPQLRAVLDRHSGNEEVATNCAGCFANLSTHVDNKVPLMVVVPQLRAALDRHPGNAGLATKCAVCFWSLAAYADNRLPLMAVVPQLRAAMDQDSADLATKCAGCFTNLAVSDDNKVPLTAVVPQLRTALDCHPDLAPLAGGPVRWLLREPRPPCRQPRALDGGCPAAAGRPGSTPGQRRRGGPVRWLLQEPR
jgi:hypothetical protein